MEWLSRNTFFPLKSFWDVPLYFHINFSISFSCSLFWAGFWSSSMSYGLPLLAPPNESFYLLLPLLVNFCHETFFFTHSCIGLESPLCNVHQPYLQNLVMCSQFWSCLCFYLNTLLSKNVCHYWILGGGVLLSPSWECGCQKNNP